MRKIALPLLFTTVPQISLPLLTNWERQSRRQRGIASMSAPDASGQRVVIINVSDMSRVTHKLCLTFCRCCLCYVLVPCWQAVSAKYQIRNGKRKHLSIVELKCISKDGLLRNRDFCCCRRRRCLATVLSKCLQRQADSQISHPVRQLTHLLTHAHIRTGIHVGSLAAHMWRNATFSLASPCRRWNAECSCFASVLSAFSLVCWSGAFLVSA